jgi:hypothetical protein
MATFYCTEDKVRDIYGNEFTWEEHNRNTHPFYGLDRTLRDKTNFETESINEIKIVKIDKKEKESIYRPKYFNDFIGQNSAKLKAKMCLTRISQGIKTHIFLSALAGHGKTTFARIMENELDLVMGKKTNFIETNGKLLDLNTIQKVLNQINNYDGYSIWFVDEIDATEPEFLKLLNSVLEDFTINNQPIKNFTFICRFFIPTYPLNFRELVIFCSN